MVDRQQCPAITDMRAHEVAAHTSILKALRRDYASAQQLLKRILAKFEGKMASAGGAGSSATSPGGSDSISAASVGGRKRGGGGGGGAAGAGGQDGTPHYQRFTLSTEKRGYFHDLEHLTFLSERERLEKNMNASSAQTAQTRPEVQAVMDELVKCFEESPKRCIALLRFFIRTSVQPSVGDYVFLPLSPGRGIARVRMMDLSGAREEVREPLVALRIASAGMLPGFFSSGDVVMVGVRWRLARLVFRWALNRRCGSRATAAGAHAA